RNGSWGVLVLLAHAVIDTLYNSIGEWAMTLRQNWSRTLMAFTGLAALVAVWVFMFLWMNIYTELFFDPWNTTLIPPPAGSLEEAICHFFNGPGEFMLSFVVLAINAALFVRALRRG